MITYFWQTTKNVACSMHHGFDFRTKNSSFQNPILLVMTSVGCAHANCACDQRLPEGSKQAP